MLTAVKEPRKVKTSGTVGLDITVKPPELFSGRDGTVTQLGSTNSYVLTQGVRGDSVIFSLYNEANRPVNIPDRIAQALRAHDITRKTLIDYLSESKAERIGLDQGIPQNGILFSQFVEEFGLSSSETERLLAKLIPLSKGGILEKSQLDSMADTSLITREFKISTDSQERYFILQCGKELRVFLTVNEDMRPLPPEQWKISLQPDSSQLRPEHIADMAILSHYQTSSRGRPLPNLPYAVNHQNGMITVVDTVQGKRLLSERANCYTLDPQDEGRIFFIDAQNSLQMVEVHKAKGKSITVPSYPLPIEGKAIEMKMDPHGNFFAILVEKNGKRELVLIERDTKKVSGVIEELGSTFDFNRYGEIYFSDAQGRVRLASTNIHRFSPDGLADAREMEKVRLSTLLKSATAANLPDLPPEPVSTRALSPQQTFSVREQVIAEARTKLTARLAPELAKASNPEQLEAMSRRLQILKQTDEYRAYPEIFSEIEERLAEKVDAVELEKLHGLMQKFREFLGKKLRIDDLTALNDSWGEIKRIRTSIAISNEDLRKSVDDEYTELRDAARKIGEELEKKVETNLAQSFPKIEALVRETIYTKDLNALRATQEFIDFETTVQSIGNTEQRTQWRNRYQTLFRVQEQKIAKTSVSQETERMNRLAETLEDVQSIYRDIEEEVGRIQHSTELVRWRRRNPLVLRYRALAVSLPSDMRTQKENELEQLMERRRKELSQVENQNVLRSAETVTFGSEPFPIAPEVRMIFRPVIRPSPSSQDSGRLIYRDITGREFTPEWKEVPFDMNTEETRRAIQATSQEAEAYFESLKPGIPTYNSKWVINDWSREILAKLAQACRERLEIGEGIVILEGEAGCGKDVFWKMLAHFAQRGLELIPCNAQTQKEDITHDFEYSPEKGTIRIPSKFVQCVQVPYTIALFGEINTAPTGVVKMLNSAFDGTRLIPMPHGRSIQIEPSVIMAGTMNPQYYLATQRLSQEVLSRATIIKVDYPALYKNHTPDKLTPFEAEIYSKYIPALADTSQEEFYLMWDTVANKENQDGEKFLTTERRQLINHLARIVKIAHEIRSEYSRYQKGDSSAAKREFVFTLREGIQIASRLKPDSKVGEVLKEIVLPKISDPTEYLEVEALIDRTV